MGGGEDVRIEIPAANVSGSCTTYPGLEDCTVTDDSGRPVEGVTAIDIRIRPGEPVEAVVSMVGVHGTIEAVRGEDAWDVGFRAGVEACRAAVAERRARGEPCEDVCCGAEYDDIEAALEKVEATR
jgi:hypothetical protein